MDHIFGRTRYQKVESIDLEGTDDGEKQPQPSKRRLFDFVVILNLMLVLGLVISASDSLWLFTKDASSLCTPEAVSTYSPIFSRLPVRWHTKKMVNTFWPARNASVYQKLSSPEVDKAWDRITLQYGFPITAGEALKMDKNLQRLWPFASATGEKLYTAQLELTHELHCLDLLRHFAFPEYYGDLREKWGGNKFLPVEPHLLHCTYLLFQSLTCHADLEVVTFNKLKGFPGPFPDFSVERRCRNYDEILEWVEKNQIDKSEVLLAQDTPTPEDIEELEPEGIILPPKANDTE